ncbi:MAG: hypothetical protein ACLQLC_13395 [Candidatus Sulfotelmatobacter sp.]
MSEVIYIPLRDEEMDCWRPVHADRVSNGIYEITVDVEPGDERWLFPPRSRVRCREHAFVDGHVGLVAFELAK